MKIISLTSGLLYQSVCHTVNVSFQWSNEAHGDKPAHTGLWYVPGGGGGGGTCQNLDRDARPIFLGLKFGQILFFWVGNFISYFSGFRKVSAIFLGLTNFQLFFWVFQFLYHTLEYLE